MNGFEIASIIAASVGMPLLGVAAILRVILQWRESEHRKRIQMADRHAEIMAIFRLARDYERIGGYPPGFPTLADIKREMNLPDSRKQERSSE